MDNLFLVLFFKNCCKVDEKLINALYIARGGSWTSSEAAAANIFLLTKMSNAEQPSKEAATKQPQENEASPQQSARLPETSSVVSLEDKPIQNIPTFLDVAFFKSRRSILYSETGVGKSLLSIEVGKSDEFKRPLYILVDSDGGEDVYRYRQILGNKAVVITLKMFQEKAETMERNKRQTADWQILVESGMMDDIQRRQLHRVQDITDRVYRRMGIKNTDYRGSDPLSVLEATIDEAIEFLKVDSVFIDSINGLFGDVRKINRLMIRRITQQAADHKITLVCLHHTNKAGSISGPGAIIEAFDYVYRLSVDPVFNTDSEDETILLLEEEKARYSKPHSFRIKRTINGQNPPKYELLEQRDYYHGNAVLARAPNLTERITAVISDLKGKSISFEDLRERLGGNQSFTAGGIKNCLKSLEDKGIVQKMDGTWNRIEIL
jgi:hypothetical protein